MVKCFAVAAVSFGCVVFGSHASSKDLVPIELAKAQRETIRSSSASAKPATGRAHSSSRKGKSPVQPNVDGAVYMHDLKVGQVGVLQNYDYRQSVRFKVTSVVNGSNLIATYDDIGFQNVAGDPAGGYITHHYVDFWLKGFSTKGIVDDDDVRIPWVVKVSGTQNYGGHTVLLIEPFIKTEEERRADAAAAIESKRRKNRGLRQISKGRLRTKKHGGGSGPRGRHP